MGSTNTSVKRNQIQGLIDDFATFMWRGVNAWEKYGAFIINEGKGDLKFYNGSSFSNEYSTPMFSTSSGNLLGMSFKIQPIKFKVGVYWFSIEEYQEFLDWLNPYEINYLSFGHDLKYGYLVKLAGRADSPRYVIGNENGSPRYYTELDLSWEVQGDSCIRSVVPYEWNTTWTQTPTSKILKWNINANGDISEQSLLDTPLVLEIPLIVEDTTSSLEFKKDDNTLFTVFFQNLTPSSESSSESSDDDETEGYESLRDFYEDDTRPSKFNIRYDSESGLLFLQIGENNNWKLLSNITDNDSGDFIISSLAVEKYHLPGKFSIGEKNISDITFSLTLTGFSLVSGEDNISSVYDSSLTIYSRKNVI